MLLVLPHLQEVGQLIPVICEQGTLFDVDSCLTRYWKLSICVQVLAKSCKMIPVMVMGTLIGGKFYSTLEYGCAFMIAAGISLFARQSSSKVTSKLVAPNAPLGYGLCTLNLFFDGYTNATQVCCPQVMQLIGGTLPILSDVSPNVFLQ